MINEPNTPSLSRLTVQDSGTTSVFSRCLPKPKTPKEDKMKKAA